MSYFKQQIANTKAYRLERENLADYVIANPDCFPELFQSAIDLTWPFHYKACWILDLVLEKKPDFLCGRLAQLCDALPDLTHDAAQRCIGRILWKAIASKEGRQWFTAEESERIATTCFDWLVADGKVAAKAYAIYILGELGKRIDWIYPELEPLLQKDYSDHSPAYKAASRRVLKKLRL